eukprot:CAMPEP_0114356294 /NCGR_PEP_ID=MMETSP0101-20121206/20855_1 /TAXON_ID=38822 ORGANISM="Pteridomonas danica, Strain PT" /NCGR_SAMPLE_ID=MMETSP0101 /ASSEMBLY_ACC=CAM_ASM_000211 /LENGTH=549 /DNA_ID=CAMNT_0001498657 /DNA_START=28 /DNA_END=1677 /DNA_ORIENTATION=+
MTILGVAALSLVVASKATAMSVDYTEMFFNQTMTILGVAALSLVVASKATAMSVDYTEMFFNQSLDHFHADEHTKWEHRYLFSDAYWDGSGALENGCKGPILFYTGNEGDVTGFWDSNGFMIDYLAPKWNALLIFAEERYYGKSMPFGDDSYLPENLGYLSTSQVLEDYVELIEYLKSTLDNAINCPVIAFGGSYGGTLTTLLRVNHPSSIIGGLAASAPIGYYDIDGWDIHNVNEYTWSDIVTKDYNEADPKCLNAIQTSIDVINKASIEDVMESFNVCEANGVGPTSQADLFIYGLEGLCQMNYPYQIDATPAWPVNYTCSVLIDAMNTDDSHTILTAAGQIGQMSLGYIGEDDCFPTLEEGPGGVPGDGPGPDSWGWQSCTENLHTFSARGIRNYTFNMETSANQPCADIFGNDASTGQPLVQPDTSLLTRRYGGYKIGDGLTGVSNLIWSNGLLDPWSGGGFLIEPSTSTSTSTSRAMSSSDDQGNVWISMPSGAHHLDLRGPNDADPSDVTDARGIEEEVMKGWIDDYDQKTTQLMKKKGTDIA